MLVRRNGEACGSPDASRFDDELALQELIAESPKLVAREGAPAAVALREFTIPAAGSLDVLLAHTDGHLTLVEAKLNRNPEIRRAVVGQLLGYAGGLWQMTHEQLDIQVRSSTGETLASLVAGRRTSSSRRMRSGRRWGRTCGQDTSGSCSPWTRSRTTFVVR